VPVFRVLITAAVRLYREGLAQYLGQANCFDVVRTAADVGETLTAVRELRPDVVLLDMTTPGSHAAIPDITAQSPATRVVALGVGDSDGDVLACAEAGISGYVSRDGSLDDLVTAIECTARGELPCTPRVAGTLLRRVAALAADAAPTPPVTALTVREREIARLVEDGLSNKQIAGRLGIEVATVKNHVHNLLEKLQVHRRGEAVARLRRRDGLRPAPTGAVSA